MRGLPASGPDIAAAGAHPAVPGLAFDPPGWLPGGHAQTVWPALFARSQPGPAPAWRRERWTLPDGDFIDADWLVERDALDRDAAARPLLVLFHGLEGSSRSPYARAYAAAAARRGWACVLPHFRGCSGELNLAPRAYHSGDHEEIARLLARAAAGRRGPVVAIGVSLGGNALLRWAQEQGHAAASCVAALAAVGAPIDLTVCGRALGRGLNRWLYTPMFLRTMKPKALAKLAQHPGLFDRERLLAARTLQAFDDVFTGPLHGFRGVEDYWRRASAAPALADIRVPALLLNALNDPFVPAACLPRAMPAGSPVRLWQPGHGGHVGFAATGFPGRLDPGADALLDWLAAAAGSSRTVAA